MVKIKLEDTKTIQTVGLNGETNGYLIELFKKEEKVPLYLISICPQSFKGYYVHEIRESNYYCLSGKVKIMLYDLVEKSKDEIILDAESRKRICVPKNFAFGLENISDEEAKIINLSIPAYDPKNIDSKKYTKEELEILIKK